MGTIKKFLGYTPENKEIDDNGREYLAETTNPGAMLAVNCVLVIKKNDVTFTQEEIDFVTNLLNLPLLKRLDDYGNKP